jgi:hypothetical protein
MRVVPLFQPLLGYYRGDVHYYLATPYSADGPDDGRDSLGVSLSTGRVDRCPREPEATQR